jgi:hypothetical protein
MASLQNVKLYERSSKIECRITIRFRNSTLRYVTQRIGKMGSHRDSYRLGIVAHLCSPSYLRGRDWENDSSMSAWARSYQDPVSTNNLDVVVHACESQLLRKYK